MGSKLPEPQRRALDAAFGVRDHATPDLFGVAMAALGLVVEASAAGPAVLVVDDAHWIDRSSAAVLSFMARRVETVPIVLLIAARPGYATSLEESRLPTLDLDRLSPTSAAALLDRDAPDLHPVTRARVLAEAAGNPLALGFGLVPESSYVATIAAPKVPDRVSTSLWMKQLLRTP